MGIRLRLCLLGFICGEESSAAHVRSGTGRRLVWNQDQDAEGNVAILWLFCRTFPVQLDPFIAILYAAAGTRERG
jgi:hypothetical protein